MTRRVFLRFMGLAAGVLAFGESLRLGRGSEESLQPTPAAAPPPTMTIYDNPLRQGCWIRFEPSGTFPTGKMFFLSDYSRLQLERPDARVRAKIRGITA